jgi:hypothetical protein
MAAKSDPGMRSGSPSEPLIAEWLNGQDIQHWIRYFRDHVGEQENLVAGDLNSSLGDGLRNLIRCE